MIENWRPVIGYEGFYEVSDQGRVRSLDRLVVSSNGRARLFAGKVLKHGFSKGYPRVNLSRDDVPRCALIHQLVLESFVGPCPVGQEVRHWDGSRINCSLGNLLYGTPVDNHADRVRHGTDNAGERQGSSRLKTSDVLEIRRLCADGVSQSKIARQFGVDQSHISDIKNRLRWRHV